MRTVSPERVNEPSTTASTPSSRAISRSRCFVPLYCIADVREMTFTERICARLAVSASVMPSAK